MLGCNGCCAFEQVLQRRLPRLAWMHALNRLSELHLVAEEHDILGSRGHRDEVGQRNLTRLVDEEVVELVLQLGRGEEPSGACDKLK